MKVYLESTEIAGMEEAASNLRDRLLVRLLAHLGCRISEALAIKPEDIDFRVGTITIQHLKSRVKVVCPQCAAMLGKTHRFCPKCGAEIAGARTREQEHRRVRTLPIDAVTLDMLKEYIERGGVVQRNGKMLVFGIGRGQAWRVVTECARNAGLGNLTNPDTGRVRGVSPHRLRDAFAVHAMKLDDSGDGLRLLQEHLGHESFDTTAKYRKISGQEHRQWYRKLWPEEGNHG